MPASRGTRFVGRQAELEMLRAELDGALRGEGRLVVLLGEPGIGKTRTATALASEARERGAAVVWGRCHESEGAPAYWPWVQALTAYVKDTEREPVSPLAREPVDREHSDQRTREIEALLPALRAGTGLSDAHEAPDRARFELFDRVVTALAPAARAQPLLIILDDLHWADIGSLRLLEFVACELGTMPLFLLGTAREAELARQTDAAALLSAVVRLGRGLTLAGLSGPEVRDLLTDRLGRAPEDGLVNDVVGLSDGNPFFVIEMLHLLDARAETAPRKHGPLALPPGVQELLRRRLDPLPSPTRQLLEIAAVVGRDFDLAPLAAVLDEAADALLDRLAPALDAGIVREVAGALQRYAFTHALMRETVYTLLAPKARIALHAAVGAALEAAVPRDDVERSALAHHFFAAAQGGDPSKAIRYACEAGERALDVLAFEEAVRQFERALAAAATAPDDALHLRLLAGLAEAVHGAGDPVRAETLCREAIVIARRCGATAFAKTVLQCAGVRAEFGITDIEMNTLLAEALDLLPPEPDALRARLMVRLAAGLSLQPGAERQRRLLADEATAMARRLGDPATLSFVLARRLIGLLGPDTLTERLETTDEILNTKTSSRQAELSALVFRVDDLAQQGDRAGLDQMLALFEQKAQASRLPFFLWMAAIFRATMALLEGRLADAETLANDAALLGQRVQARTALLYFSVQLLMLRGTQARFAEIEPLVEMGVTQTGASTWRCALAEFYQRSGRTAEARREFEGLAADDFASIPRDTMWLQGMYLLAGTSARLGDARRAAVLYEHLKPFAGSIAIAWPLVTVIGPIDEALGMLTTVLEQYQAAEQHFTDALAIAERMRGLPSQADVRHQWARMLIQRNRRGDRERAHALLDEAEEIARAVGMSLLMDWISEARETARHSLPARAVGAEHAPVTGEGLRRGTVLSLVPRPAAPDQRSGSFRRDGNVWSLDFEGRTTRVRDMLGLAHIARLLREPEREVHVLDLAGGSHQAAGERPAGDAGVLLDAQARAEYTARLRDAREELDEAERLNDRGRVERMREEVEFLTAELSRGFGLGGRSRRAGMASERARVAVTRAIKYAIDRIGEHDPALAEHLRLAVRTGMFCTYVPPTRDRVSWKL